MNNNHFMVSTVMTDSKAFNFWMLLSLCMHSKNMIILCKFSKSLCYTSTEKNVKFGQTFSL